MMPLVMKLDLGGAFTFRTLGLQGLWRCHRLHLPCLALRLCRRSAVETRQCWLLGLWFPQLLLPQSSFAARRRSLYHQPARLLAPRLSKCSQGCITQSVSVLRLSVCRQMLGMDAVGPLQGALMP